MSIYVARADIATLAGLRPACAAGGDLTWAATCGVVFAGVLAAAVLGDARILFAAGLCSVFGIVFAMRPAWGVAVVVVIRPSMDVFAVENWPESAPCSLIRPL